MADENKLPKLEFDDEPKKVGLPALSFDDDKPAAEPPPPDDVTDEEISKFARGKKKLPEFDRNTIPDLVNSLDEGVPGSALAEKAGRYVMSHAAAPFSDESADQISAKMKAIVDRDRAEREARSPGAVKAGHFLGAMAAGPTAASEITAAGEVVPGVAKGVVPALSRIGVNTGVAAVDRASQEDNLPDALREGKKAAGWAAALSTLLEAAGPAGRGLNSFANRRAVKSLEPTLAQQERLMTQDQVQNLGQELRDNGVVRFGSSVEDMAPRMDEMLQAKGQRIGEIRNAADEALAASKLSDAPIPGVDMTRLRDKGNAMEAFSDASIGADQAMAKAYRKDAERLARLPERNVAETQDVIQSLNDQIPFHKPVSEMTPAQQAQMELRRDLVGQTDDVIRQTRPQDLAEYEKTKKLFGTLKEGDKILDKAVARNARNADVGLRDLLIANARKNNGTLGDTAKQTLMAVASKMARERGNAAMASTAGRLANILQGNPDALGKYAAPLMEAATRGNKAVMATHLMLMKDPEYAAMMQEPAK